MPESRRFPLAVFGTGALLVVLAAANVAQLAASGRSGSALGADPGPGRVPQDAGEIGSADEQDMVARDFTQDCLRSGCHGQIDDTPWVHAPLAVGACETCHVPLPADPGGKAHRFESPRAKQEQCSYCHSPADEQEFVHGAFATGDCLSCHDPHGGATHVLLRAADPNQLCNKCHTLRRPEGPEHASALPGLLDHKFLHPPVVDGQCLDCHRSHQSEHKGLLHKDPRSLCLDCHDKVHQTLSEAEHVHGPLLTGCADCHLPHGGEDKALLRESGRQLCLGCHQEVWDKLVADPHVHGPMRQGRECLECHDAHSGETPALVVGTGAESCLRCHHRILKHPSGRRIANIEKEVARPFVHDPVGEGKCEACHLPHSSQHRALLTGSYPTDYYVPFSEAAYAACFSCHDATMVTHKKTTTSTGFRDGDRNLHHAHVHLEKGRSCRMCHEVHAADSPALMRSKVSFGGSGWELPIQFEQTPSGGTCAPACHTTRSYDRLSPRTPDRR